MQGIFVVILGMGAVGGINMARHATLTMVIFGCTRISWRGARYAIISWHKNRIFISEVYSASKSWESS
jgi:hypothetical protein